MVEIVRTLTVETAEPGLGTARRMHAILTARGGEGVDVVHLWTDDEVLAAELVPGAQLDIRVVPPRRTFVIRRGADGAHEWLATAPTTGAAIIWTAAEDEAAHFYGHAVALEDARLCTAAGHTVAVLPRDAAVPRG